MKFIELIQKNRSYRRFYEKIIIPRKSLEELVNYARLSASAANLQQLRFKLIHQKDICLQIFPNLKWAGYLTDWEGPVPGERPSAYIVLCAEKDHSNHIYCDAGIASQSVLLGAVEKGFGGCILASIDRDNLRKILKIEDKFVILYVIALGKPKEIVKIVEMKDNNVKYWRDENDVHYVPKRKLDNLLL